MTTRGPIPPPMLLVLALAWIAGTPAGGGEVPPREANDGNVVLSGVPEVPQDLIDRLNRYQNVRSAAFEDWSQDGESIYITTRFGNTTQLHYVASPGGARRQLTFFPEPVAGAKRRPGASDLLFSMDEGGAEFYQLFLLDPRAGSAQRVTDGSSRNGSATWSGDGRLIAYQSTRRNGRANDVWLMEAENPDSARLALEAPDGFSWSPAHFDRQGDRLLVNHYVSVTDSRIHLLDLQTGGRQLIAGGEGSSGVHDGLEFDPHHGGIYLLTDEGSEFTRLAHLSLPGGAMEILTEAIAWDVDSFDLSDDGSRAAFTVNEDGIDRLYLMDPMDRRMKRVERIPEGLVHDLRFSPNGRRLAMTLESATTPDDVYTLELGADALADTGLTRWTSSETGGLDTARFAEPELIHFRSFDDREIPAFVMKPSGPGPFPVVIRIHGGPESQARPGFSSVYQMWVAELGAAVIYPNVRGSAGYGKEYVKLDNGYRREDSVRDIGSLLDWIATRPDLDRHRVAVYGGSYGGYMVLASLMHYSDRIRAGVDIVGISNFVTFLENTQDYRRDRRRVEYGDERDPEMRAHLEAISPSNNAGRITAPLLVAQGRNDPRVPLGESEQIVEAVRGAGFDVWYMIARNEGHGFRKKENRDLYQQIVMMFLEKHLLAPATQDGPVDRRSTSSPG